MTARITGTSGKPQPTNIQTSTTHFPHTPYNTSLRTHIHTHFANRSTYSMQPNAVLNRYPPLINEEENTISREERVHLSRLRCGHHPVLPSYTNRINLTCSDTCTLCNNAEGSLEHIILHCPYLLTPQKQLYHTITWTPLDTPYPSLQLPARRRSDREHTHRTPPPPHAHNDTALVSGPGETCLQKPGKQFLPQAVLSTKTRRV